VEDENVDVIDKKIKEASSEWQKLNVKYVKEGITLLADTS
jgi:hypothetical protein